MLLSEHRGFLQVGTKKVSKLKREGTSKQGCGWEADRSQWSPVTQPVGLKHLCAASHPISHQILLTKSFYPLEATTHKAEHTV